MKEVSWKVELVNTSGMTEERIESFKDNELLKVYYGFRRCYSPEIDKFIDNVYTEELNKYGKLSDESREKVETFIRKMRKTPHETPIEHVNLTFHISRISRAHSHQFVRHRVASHCVSSDTKIATSSQRTHGKTIEELFRYKEQYKQLIQIRCVDESTGLINYNNLDDIVYTGKQMCYEIITNFGYSIKATALHRFLTVNGWKRVNELSIGDIVYVNGLECYKDKDWLDNEYNNLNKSQSEIGEFCGVSKHTIRSWIRKFELQKEPGSWCIGKEPVNKGRTKFDYEPMMKTSVKMMGNSGPRVPWTKENNPAWKGDDVSIYGAYGRMNREFTKTHVCNNCGFEGNTEFHHIDKNPWNNELSNIIELCTSCHHAIHRKELREKIIPNSIVSIVPVGEMDTYDICMPDPHHNFIANGFVVHNSQQSQRYIQFDNIEVIIPPSIKLDSYALDAYINMMNTIEQTYLYLVNDRNIPAEDARYVLPNAAATSIVTTMNLRELLHFFKERCCYRAQWEIRDVSNQMLAICKDLFPSIFENAGPKCMALHKCPETDSCDVKPYKK